MKIYQFTSFVVAALAFSSLTYAQLGCNTCTHPGHLTGEPSHFSYPLTTSGYGHHSGGILGRHHARKETWDARKAEADRIARRNDAWPKPFDCWDRQAYHNLFNPMFAAGYESHNVLCNQHFDPESHTLNGLGRSVLASIMQNLPAHRRQVFISQATEPAVAQARLAHLNQVVDMWYNQNGQPVQVAFSNAIPATLPGYRAEAVMQGMIQSTPAPVVPLQTSGMGIERSQNR